MPRTLLVTGSSGLIGSEVCAYFAREAGGFQHHELKMRACYLLTQSLEKTIRQIDEA